MVAAKHFYGETFNLYLNFAKGTTTKAQGTTAIAFGVVGYFEDRLSLKILDLLVYITL